MTPNEEYLLKPRSGELGLYYQNVNGLRTKTNIFKQAMDISNFKIYVLTETGLHDLTSEYIVYRCDRIIGITSDKTQKGGILIAVCFFVFFISIAV